MIINKSNIKEIVKGDNTINMFYKCLRLGWQSGVSFGESRLTSWDKEKESMWIRPMPKKDDLGMEVIGNDNINEANPVLLSSLSEEAQKQKIEEGSVFERKGVKLVANFGFGSKALEPKGYEVVDFDCWTFENQDEDNEQDTFTTWILESLPDGTQVYNLIALRAAESFDRYTILKQGDYSTGQYASARIE